MALQLPWFVRACRQHRYRGFCSHCDDCQLYVAGGEQDGYSVDDEHAHNHGDDAEEEEDDDAEGEHDDDQVKIMLLLERMLSVAGVHAVLLSCWCSC